MKKVKKLFGEKPEKVVVLRTLVEFDAEGIAEVEDEIAEVLSTIPGYEVEADAEVEDNVVEEDASEEEEKPAKKVPKRPAPRK